MRMSRAGRERGCGDCARGVGSGEGGEDARTLRRGALEAPHGLGLHHQPLVSFFFGTPHLIPLTLVLLPVAPQFDRLGGIAPAPAHESVESASDLAPSNTLVHDVFSSLHVTYGIQDVAE